MSQEDHEYVTRAEAKALSAQVAELQSALISLTSGLTYLTGKIDGLTLGLRGKDSNSHD
jgi:hypothetical protein